MPVDHRYDDKRVIPACSGVRPEHPVADLGDIIQAARLRDEIELNTGWHQGGFQHFQELRKPRGTDTQAHRVLSCPFLHVPHRGFVAVFGPHPTPEAARFDAGGGGQKAQAVDNPARRTPRRRQRNC